MFGPFKQNSKVVHLLYQYRRVYRKRWRGSRDHCWISCIQYSRHHCNLWNFCWTGKGHFDVMLYVCDMIVWWATVTPELTRRYFWKHTHHPNTTLEPGCLIVFHHSPRRLWYVTGDCQSLSYWFQKRHVELIKIGLTWRIIRACRLHTFITRIKSGFNISYLFIINYNNFYQYWRDSN